MEKARVQIKINITETEFIGTSKRNTNGKKVYANQKKQKIQAGNKNVFISLPTKYPFAKMPKLNIIAIILSIIPESTKISSFVKIIFF